jgi:hypothetical protein
MTFRDASASLERIAALEEEVRALREELKALRAENAKLRAEADEDKDAVITQLMAERDALAKKLEDGGAPAAEEPYVSPFEGALKDFAKRRGIF